MKMDTIKIPQKNKDIIKAINRKLFLQIGISVLWCAGVSVIMALAGYRYFEASLGGGTAITIWGILCIIPFYIFKAWQWVIDRPFDGTVTECRQTSSATMNGLYRSTLKRLYTQNIEILKNNGRTKTVKLTWDSDKNVPFYYKGDHVRYYRGTKFMQVISDKPDAPRICVMCGTQNLPDDNFCSICSKSLIDQRQHC